MDELDRLTSEDKKDSTFDSETELTLDDMSVSYIPWPKVGEITEWFELQKIIKTKNVMRKDKDGNQFSIALAKRDGSGKDAYICKTDKGDLTLQSWEVYGKIGKICKDRKAIKGNRFKVFHEFDGSVSRKQVPEIMKLTGKSESEAITYKDQIKRMEKENKIYKVLTVDNDGKEVVVEL